MYVKKTLFNTFRTHDSQKDIGGALRMALVLLVPLGLGRQGDDKSKEK